MAKSIVRTPKNKDADYDFIAFTFNDQHSFEDLHIYRTSDGDRYNGELNVQSTDKTVAIPGMEGLLFQGSDVKQKVFNISFAFDNFSDQDLRKLKRWLNDKEIHDLWFAEEPYKVYSAKITGVSTMSYLPFEEKGTDGKVSRIYRGDGKIQFTAYYPYAHTPDEVWNWDDSDEDNPKWVYAGSGNVYSSYVNFYNYEDIKHNLPGYGDGINPFGDLPFHFVAELDNPISKAKTTVRVSYGNNEISAEYEIQAPSSALNEGQEYIIGG